MIEKIINGKTYLFVSIPKNVVHVQTEKSIMDLLKDNAEDSELVVVYNDSRYCGSPRTRYTQKIPKGKYTIIGKASELTEAQCWMLASTSPQKLMDFICMKPETTLIL